MLDEYDGPVSQLIRESNTTKVHHEVVSNFLGTMVSGVFKDNKYVTGGLINSCLDIKGTLSRYANNLMSIPFLENPTFVDYCGFSHEEVTELLQRPKFQGFDADSILNVFNGYKSLNGTKIYNTYSLLMYLSDWAGLRNKLKKQGKPTPEKKIPIPTARFWVDRGIPELEKMFSFDKIRQKVFDLQNEGSIEISILIDKMTVDDLFSLKELLISSPQSDVSDCNVELFFHYMKFRGYFYVKDISGERMTLAVPNMEVAYIFTRKLYRKDFYEQRLHLKPSRYIKALNSLDKSNEKAFEELGQAIVDMFPFEFPENHDEVKGILYAFAFGKFKTVRCEPFVIEGRRYRADIIIIKKNDVGIVIEVASSGKDEEGALKQIFDNRYDDGLSGYNTKQQIYVGVKYNHDNGSVDICGTGGTTKLKWGPLVKKIRVSAKKESR